MLVADFKEVLFTIVLIWSNNNERGLGVLWILDRGQLPFPVFSEESIIS